MDSDGRSADELKREGNAAFEQGDWEAARNFYSKAIDFEEAGRKRQQLLGVLYSNRSVTWAMLDRYREALTDAEKAIEIRPEWPRGYARASVALMGLLRLKEAKDAIENGKRQDPNDVMLSSLAVHLDALLIPASSKRKAPEGSTFTEALEQIRRSGVERPMSVVVLSGFLGSGKTTLLNRLLSSNQGHPRMAVLVNDMAAINIDADRVRHHRSFSQTTEALVELTNGCVCCTLRGDLIKEATRLLCMKRFDMLVIESTGIGEPMPVAATFTTEDFHGATLRSYFSIQNMVTLVDGYQVLKELESGSLLKDREMGATDDDQRTISQLLIDQIEFADVLLINKCDLITEQDQYKLHSLMKKLNPNAEIFPTIKADIDSKEILNKKRFRTDRAKLFQGFEIEMIDPHLSEKEEYGIGSVVFVDHRPFHPVRLHRFLFGDDINGDVWLSEMSPLRRIYRSKGTFYLANVMDAKLIWSTAGNAVQFEQEGRWLGSMLSQHLWPNDDPDWDNTFGDRQQKLVLIGPTDRLTSIRSALTDCLLTDDEHAYGEAEWKSMDPKNLWKLDPDSSQDGDLDSSQDGNEIASQDGDLD